MSRLTLERHQVWIYLAAIAIGLTSGRLWPAAGPVLEGLLWPLLALLLLATFLQVPLLHVRDALRDRRFAAAVLGGKFVVMPLLAWALGGLFAVVGALRLGVLLVLLVPCTDWVITFSQLGRGDVARAVAVTPLNLLLQLLLLPAYLWLMGDGQGLGAWDGAALAPAVLIVLVPLAAAAVAERWLERHPAGGCWRQAAGWWPVPLLGLVLLSIAGAQVGAVRQAAAEVLMSVPVFVLFLLLALAAALVIAAVMKLPVAQARTLAFSLGTRNSFVVLPLALALPAGWELAAVVIVAQSLVELLGMVAYVWVVPRLTGLRG